MVLLRYAALGEMVSLNVGAPCTLKATELDTTATDGGLLILTSTPALARSVDAPITT
jgi:hypothetical protein